MKKLIKKYLKGNCNPEEIAAIHEWYNSFETEQDPADFITSQQQKELKFRLLTNIKRNVASLELKSTQTNKRKTVSRTLYLLSGVAAMLIDRKSVV